MVLGITSLIPLMLIALVPLLTGDIPSTHFAPLVPLTHDAKGLIVDGSWNMRASWGGRTARGACGPDLSAGGRYPPVSASTAS